MKGGETLMCQPHPAALGYRAWTRKIRDALNKMWIGCSQHSGWCMAMYGLHGHRQGSPDPPASRPTAAKAKYQGQGRSKRHSGGTGIQIGGVGSWDCHSHVPVCGISVLHGYMDTSIACLESLPSPEKAPGETHLETEWFPNTLADHRS